MAACIKNPVAERSWISTVDSDAVLWLKAKLCNLTIRRADPRLSEAPCSIDARIDKDFLSLHQPHALKLVNSKFLFLSESAPERPAWQPP
jgi:hypothetical protein